MLSHPVSYNCPFTLLFLLPSEPIWLTGRGEDTCAPAFEAGRLFAGSGAHFPSEAPAVGPDPRGGRIHHRCPLVHLSAVCSLPSLEGYARSAASLPPTPGFPGAPAAGRLHRPLRGCGAPTAASQWHLALGCRTALQQQPPQCPSALGPARTGPPAAQNQGHGPRLGQRAELLGYLQERSPRPS